MDKKRLQELAGIPTRNEQLKNKEDQLIMEIVQEMHDRGYTQTLEEQGQLAAGLKRAGSAIAGGVKGGVQQVQKGLEAAASGARMAPQAMKALAPYASQLMTILSDPQLSMKFKQLVKLAGQKGQEQQAAPEQGQEQQAQPQQGAEQVQ